MNTENLDKIIQNYIEDIPNSYNAEHDELFKWRAVKHFKENWNIDADDFAGMLKEAMKETSVFVDNSTVQPLVGLVKIAEQNPDVVKDVFKRLDECNSKPLIEKQEVIEDCLDILNKEVKKYYGNSWKYKQEKRTIIFYLTVMHPDDNYFYKSTEAMNMAKCIDFIDLGTGSNFRLSSYYRMCDQIKEHIANNKELLDIHNSYLDDKCYEDKNLNLLVFNIIYCANAYSYYDKNNIKLKSLRTYSKKSQQEIEDFKELEELKSQQMDYNIKLAEKNDIISNMDEVNVKNLQVNHKKFGNGVIINQEGENIKVRFEDGSEKPFAIPSAFSSGFLTTDDTSIVEECNEIDRLEQEKQEIERQLSFTNSKIDIIKRRYGLE